MTHAPTRRRSFVAAAASLALLPSVSAAVAAVAATPETRIQVWKDPGCGCCKDWIAILEREGFRVDAVDSGNVAARKRLGLPERYGSCHTGLIGGYVIEGHVPTKYIRRLLRERPDAIGIAVPGMPVGSPGMDGPEYKGRRDPHDVLLVLKDGRARVWASYR